MDDFTYHVSRVWYRLYASFMALCSLILVSVWIGAQFITPLATAADTFGIGRTTCIMAGIHLLYSLIFYMAIAKRSAALATVVSSMLFTLVLMNGLAATDPSQASLAYIGVWLVTAACSGMFGLPLMLGGILLTGVYVLLNYDFQIAQVSNYAWALITADGLVAGWSYQFWRRHFSNTQQQQVNQLSGMLKSNQQQSAILIESIADGIIVINTEGKITLMNPAAAAMTEWPVTEAVGVDAQLVAKLSHENGEDIKDEDNPFITVLKQQAHINQTLQLDGRDGKKQIISLVISPVTVPGSDMLVGAVAVIRDISEERAAEKQRADFISTASHEMRTPVAAIEGYLALALNEKVSTVDSRARGYLEKAHASTQHLGKLFQDLLTSSRAEDGRLSNHPTVVEMGSFLQQLTDDLKFSAEKKGLFVEFLVGDANEAIDATNKDSVSTHIVKPLYYVLADPDRMREVVTNLFDNACKYTEQGKISIGLTGDADVVQLYIRDTGAGIPKEDIPHLFQKFYRVDSSVTRTIGGTGLGLFICRKIVELYKGRIWVDSDLGKGSTFYINLPRLSTTRAQALQASEEAKAAVATPGA